jgi:replicative DNA helicase
MNARSDIPWTDRVPDPEVAQLRVPPHSDEAEQSVLGGLLLDATAWDRVDDKLSEADFYRLEHRLIFGAIGALVAASKPADVITVFEQLQSHGRAEDVGGMAYLNALAHSVPSAANIRRYAEIVRERSTLRALIAAADAIATSAFDPKGRDVAEVLDEAASAIGQLDRRQQRKAPRLVGDLLAAAIDRYQDLAEGRRPAGLPTGIGPLDRMLAGGLRPGKVYGIAARPSVGKSSAARTILLHLARAGVCTLLLSQEMDADELADALMAEAGRVDGAALQSGRLEKDDWERLVGAVDVLRSVPLHIDDQGGLTLAQVRSKARAVKGLQVLAIDYLQLMSSTLKGKSTNDELAEISKGLKALALELGIPIIVLSQLNRDVEKRADKEPQLSDLRDSGAIEQDLDVAVLLWTALEGDESRLVGWKVAKHRGGKKGVFAMRWEPAINDWRESVEPLRVKTGAERARGFE